MELSSQKLSTPGQLDHCSNQFAPHKWVMKKNGLKKGGEILPSCVGIIA